LYIAAAAAVAAAATVAVDFWAKSSTESDVANRKALESISTELNRIENVLGRLARDPKPDGNAVMKSRPTTQGNPNANPAK
jgi:hypothetical protein